jgi:hypothetical protein
MKLAAEIKRVFVTELLGDILQGNVRGANQSARLRHTEFQRVAMKRNADFLPETSPKRAQSHPKPARDEGIIGSEIIRTFQGGHQRIQPWFGPGLKLSPFRNVNQELLEQISGAQPGQRTRGLNQSDDSVHQRRTPAGLPDRTRLDSQKEKPAPSQVKRSRSTNSHIAMMPRSPSISMKADGRFRITSPEGRRLDQVTGVIVKQLDRPPLHKLKRTIGLETFVHPGVAARYFHGVEKNQIGSNHWSKSIKNQPESPFHLRFEMCNIGL